MGKNLFSIRICKEQANKLEVTVNCQFEKNSAVMLI